MSTLRPQSPSQPGRRLRRLRRLRRVAALCGAVAVLASGCGVGRFTGVYDLPLPGGAKLGGHPYHVTAQFQDVLDLVPQSAVKVNNVAVGRVTRIGLARDGWTAEVSMVVNGDVHLPANAVARLEQSSLLGEKYVALAAPPQAPQGTLADGAVIPVSRTNRNPEVEEVLGALSLLLNGGGIDQLHTITVQLNTALSGNEPQIRSMLTQVDRLVSNLDAHRQDITAAIDGVNRLSATLASRDQQLGGVLDNLAPGLRVLDQQRDALVTLLRSVDHLSTVAVDTVNRSRDDLVADLRALTPTLQQLGNAGQALPQALEELLTFPFPDQVLNDVRGDYLNVFITLTAPKGTRVIPLIPAVTPTSTPAEASATARTAALPLPLPAVDAPAAVPARPSASASTPGGGGGR